MITPDKQPGKRITTMPSMQPISHPRRPARRPGQSMVEFALATTLLVLMIFGILEVARLVFSASAVNNGAREGAHYMALHPDATVLSITQQIAPKLIFLSSADIRVTLECPTCSGAGACLPPSCYTALYEPLTVTVGYTLTTAVPLPGFGNGIPITTRATAQRER